MVLTTSDIRSFFLFDLIQEVSQINFYTLNEDQILTFTRIVNIFFNNAQNLKFLQEKTTEILNTKNLVILENFGHLPQRQDPLLVQKHIYEFLNS